MTPRVSYTIDGTNEVYPVSLQEPTTPELEAVIIDNVVQGPPQAHMPTPAMQPYDRSSSYLLAAVATLGNMTDSQSSDTEGCIRQLPNMSPLSTDIAGNDGDFESLSQVI